jgi:hypothetical protein
MRHALGSHRCLTQSERLAADVIRKKDKDGAMITPITRRRCGAAKNMQQMIILLWRTGNAAIPMALATARIAAFAFVIFFTAACPTAIEIIAKMPSLISSAHGQPEAFTKSQSDALNAYANALSHFKSLLSQRRAQIRSNLQLPELPGQALYLARNGIMSTYKDLTNALPSKIGRPNKFGIPPAYFDADNEPLIDEYTQLFNIMEAPPANAQSSDTPFDDVVNLGTDIARAKGLDVPNAKVAGRISLGIFFAETNGNQNIGNARSNVYKGSFQTGMSEDQSGQRKWTAIKSSIAVFDPALIVRDKEEEERIGDFDHRLNHWTAIRDGLMNAHAEPFLQIPKIVKTLPNPIDQMKLFELIQIIPSPTKLALSSGSFANWRISDPKIMGYLRNNSILTFGQADRAKSSATFGEILDAMWLFNDKFERALTKYSEIKARQNE